MIGFKEAIKRAEDEYLLRDLAIYYGLMIGRTTGNKMYYWLNKAISLAMKDYSVVTQEDLDAVR